jgi:hypothetical protein
VVQQKPNVARKSPGPRASLGTVIWFCADGQLCPRARRDLDGSICVHAMRRRGHHFVKHILGFGGGVYEQSKRQSVRSGGLCLVRATRSVFQQVRTISLVPDRVVTCGKCLVSTGSGTQICIPTEPKSRKVLGAPGSFVATFSETVSLFGGLPKICLGTLRTMPRRFEDHRGNGTFYNPAARPQSSNGTEITSLGPGDPDRG